MLKQKYKLIYVLLRIYKVFRGGVKAGRRHCKGGQPNDDKKQTREGRGGVENGQNFVDVIYGWPPSAFDTIFRCYAMSASRQSYKFEKW